MQRIFIRSLVCTALIVMFTMGLSAQEAKQAVIASGGTGTVTSGNYTIESTVGEVIIATAGSGPVCTQGIHQPNSLKVDFSIDNGFVKVFPNPVYTTAQMNIYAEERTTVTFTLHNAAGQQVLARTRELMPGVHTEYLYFTGLKNGVYILSLKESARGRKMHVKMLKL
ncbi:MAG: T9SS type A sorting domain-containing protein [Niastella sp.]|nr:T9SS type A sorting domain-containing protein [Niastella sp.]